MDDRCYHLLETLKDIQERLGERAYREAVYLALHGVGVAVQREAERRAKPLGAAKPAGKVVSFPLGDRGRLPRPPSG